MTDYQLSIRFFLQLAFILAACQVVGLLARKIMQPQVVAEMLAGVLIGPSLLGLLLPGVQAQLFPKASMSIIYAVGQVAITLYMCLVGVEFELSLIRRKLRSAASVSLAGIIAPFALGCLLALTLFNDRRFFTAGIARWQAMLFLAAAMSITAFPMLARIIQERGLTGTALGTLALAAGSIDDATAWCMMAIVLASMSLQAWTAVAAIGGGVLYTVTVLLVARPLLLRLGRKVEQAGGLDGTTLSFVLALLALCAWFTDAIGIHAVFGAFILGTAMPRGLFALELRRALAPLTRNLFLPFFFVYSGLNTRLSLVNSTSLLLIALLILLAACLGKLMACWLAARLNGESQRDAMGIGTLMNARGLMELIILNIGLERGIITPTLFTIMALMAIATTLMASPLFELVYRRGRREARVPLEPVVGAIRTP